MEVEKNSFAAFAIDSSERSYEIWPWINGAKHAKWVESEGRIRSGEGLLFRRAFRYLVDYLEHHVSLVAVGRKLPLQKVQFHCDFGWIVASDDLKAYLGKISFAQNAMLEIGHRSYFSGPSSIRGSGTLSIGNYCCIAENFCCGTSNENHPTAHPALINFAQNRRLCEDGMALDIQYAELSQRSDHTKIGNDVWIGRNSRIYHGLTVGNGAVIGEASLVTRSIENYGIYAGTPARLLRRRFGLPQIERLERIKWWNWDDGTIKKNQAFFALDVETCSLTELDNYSDI